MTSTDPLILPPEGDMFPGWGHSLSRGAPGIALVHIERAIAGTAPSGSVHVWATAMTREAVTTHHDTGCLYQGAPAVAFALHCARQPGYARALDTLDTPIATLARRKLLHAHQRIDRGQLPALREFDLIGGLTGLGAYLLLRDRAGGLVREILGYLVRLTQPLRIEGQPLPGWWSSHGPADRPSSRWPGGHGNLGMAHGIAGPLALLATAAKRGVTVPGQHEAIDRVCHFLDQWRCGTQASPWWPGTLSITEWKAGTVQQPGPPRPSWCYGTPGLARAQQLAGQALQGQPRQEFAAHALAACVRDEYQLDQLVDASLCHGWAGLLQATWRTITDAAEADHPLDHFIPHLHARMEHHLGHYGEPANDGLLEGRAGVVLARHAATADAPPASDWDACLLLAG